MSNKFALRYAILLAVISLLPPVLGYALRPPGTAVYLGVQYNVDDHMVYAAWMQQAMRGQWLFDNRFTNATQPGITIHLYFLVLGWLAKAVGLVVAPLLARALFTALSVLQLSKLIERGVSEPQRQKYCLILATLGGGIGFLVWHQFGLAITRPAPDLLSNLLFGRLPIDVWQPEAFFAPSMLTNSLFMVSYFLILLFFNLVLDARSGWRAVPMGALSIGLLMNIHSYDVLLVAMVLVAMIATIKRDDWGWVVRVATMFLGVLPAALWFVHVLQTDPVFQARAATPTFSPNFRLIVAGLLPLAIATVAGLARGRRGMLLGAWGGFVVALCIAASQHTADTAWMGLATWSAVFACVAFFVWQLRTPNPAVNLVGCWAAVGLIAPYFPAAFQRKLSMGIAVPMGILAGAGLYALVQSSPAHLRRIVALPCGLLCSLSTLMWVMRDLYYIRNNVSNTAVHKLYYRQDEADILNYLSRQSSNRTVAIAAPGSWSPTDAPDQFAEPRSPDLNPIISGLTGAYTVFGHWSETPEYAKKRALGGQVFWSENLSTAQVEAYLKVNHVDFVVVDTGTSHFPMQLGTVVAGSERMALLKTR